MPYDEAAADRIRALIRDRHRVAEKKMFGGVGFLLNGNMCCGVWREFLILRVGPERYAELLGHPDVREFDITGRPMNGWLMVNPAGYRDADSLSDWLEVAIRFVGALPPKEDTPTGRAARKSS